jgi:hypothetical protein
MQRLGAGQTAGRTVAPSRADGRQHIGSERKEVKKKKEEREKEIR